MVKCPKKQTVHPWNEGTGGDGCCLEVPVALAKAQSFQIMSDYQFTGKYVRVRMRRFFEGQHKHVFIGRVIAETPACLLLYARSFHFRKIVGLDSIAGKPVTESAGLSAGAMAERAIPWASIEFAQVLEDSVNFEAPAVWGENGNIVLDNKQNTLVTTSRDHGE